VFGRLIGHLTNSVAGGSKRLEGVHFIFGYVIPYPNQLLRFLQSLVRHHGVTGWESDGLLKYLPQKMNAAGAMGCTPHIRMAAGIPTFN
jgi:hypothetical protein